MSIKINSLELKIILNTCPFSVWAVKKFYA